MTIRNELEVLWKQQPKNWREEYLRVLGPDHPALKDRDALATLLRWTDSAYAQARAVRNPLWIWVAYQEFRDRGLPPPEWILVYLDEAASRFRAMMQAPPKDPHPAIAGALLMKRRGRGSVFSTFQHLEELTVVAELMSANARGESAHVAIGRAAQKLGVDKRTARRHRDSVRRRLQERSAP